MRAAILILHLLAATALACKVPVFRFALERWETDNYVVLYRDAGDAPEAGHHNFVARQAPGLASRFAAHYPEPIDRGSPFWSGDDLDTLLGSPLRDALLDEITSGASAVWILVEGSDPAANDAAATKLTDLLERAASTLEIPAGVVRPEQLDTGEIDLADIDTKDVLRSPIPLEIRFAVLRLAHGDAREAAFRQMLLGIIPDLASIPPVEPILVPTFGRGRMIDGLPSSRLDPATVAAASQYLCGQCSCEVKAQNPGVDLLLAADWDTLLESSYTIIDRQLPPLAGAGEFRPDERQPPQQAEPPSRGPSPLARNLFIAALAAIAALTLASLAILRPGA